MTSVTTYYLEMLSSSELVEKAATKEIVIQEVTLNAFQYNRFLYQYIGKAWLWKDKLSWSDEKWQAYVEDPNLRLWVAYVQGLPAGYFELQMQDEGNVEIMYFGLAQAFIGLGYGGYLLSQAIRCAWLWEGAQRVWVHTCSLDHPSALANYQARGMTVYKTENAVE